MRFVALLRASRSGIFRSPLPYAMAGLGVLVYWAAVALDLLALDRMSGRAEALAVATAELVACLTAVLLAATLVGEDQAGHWGPIVAASVAGAPALWISRVVAAVIAGVLAALPVVLAALYMLHTSNTLITAIIWATLPITAEALGLAAWAAVGAARVGAWPGAAMGLGLFLAARAEAGAWLAWLPPPASARPSALDLLHAALAALGPLAVGAGLARGVAARA